MIVFPHDPHWFTEFNDLSIKLRGYLKTPIIDIHHVGSTSIPGLIAKPILDIDIEIANNALLSAIISELESLGYRYEGEKGMIDRHALRRTSETVPHFPATKIKTWVEQYLYVCPSSSRELARHLHFRNTLRARPDLKNQYALIKQEALRIANGQRSVYVSEKEKIGKSFFDSVFIPN